MEIYDYCEAVRKDVKEYIESHYTKEEFEQDMKEFSNYSDWLYDEMFDEESVTGNEANPYAKSKEEADRYLYGNYELILDAYDFEYNGQIPDKSLRTPEIIDNVVRCYVLNEIISDILNEYRN